MKSFKALKTLKSGQFTVINSVDKTKLSCYTLPLTQHYSFFRNLHSSFNI